MRKIAALKEPVAGIRRLMIYAAGGDVYLFGFSAAEDGPACFDEWHATSLEAEEAARDRYGVQPGDWTLIDDPAPGAQHDWIAPTRRLREADGIPASGRFEPIPGNR